MRALLFLPLAIAVGFAAAGVLARRAGLRPRAMLLTALAIGLGTMVGAVPGTFLFFAAVVVAATGPSSGTPWNSLLALTLGGALAGVAGGAAIGARLIDRERRRTLARVVLAMVGALGGVGFVLAAASLEPNVPRERDDYGSPASLLVVPLMMVAMSLVGFAAPRGATNRRG